MPFPLKTLTKLALAVVLMTPAAAVHAHPALIDTSPKADSIIAASPSMIQLSFSEELIAKFSGIDLKDQAGKRVETGPAATAPENKKQLTIPVITSLTSGTYTVEWHAVSEDTHRVKGSYSFKISQ